MHRPIRPASGLSAGVIATGVKSERLHVGKCAAINANLQDGAEVKIRTAEVIVEHEWQVKSHQNHDRVEWKSEVYGVTLVCCNCQP